MVWLAMDALTHLEDYKRASLALVEQLAANPSSDPTSLMQRYDAALAALKQDAAKAASARPPPAAENAQERKELEASVQSLDAALLDLISRMSDFERAADVMAALK